MTAYAILFGVGIVIGALMVILSVIYRKKLQEASVVMLSMMGGFIAATSAVMALCLGFFAV